MAKNPLSERSMKTIAFILSALALSVSIFASTITGYLIDQAGNPKTGVITVRPLSSPQVIGTNYLSAGNIQITLTNGGFTNTLLQGNYLISIAGSDSPQISVPNDTNTYNFVSLINTNGLLYVFKSPGSVVKLDSSDSTFGFLLDKLGTGSFLSKTTNSPGGNESVTLAFTGSLHTNTVVSNVQTNGSGNVTNISTTTLIYFGP